MAEEVQLKSKEQFYRGINLENLKKLGIRESSKYLPARSRRSILRNFEVIEKFLERCNKKMSKNKKIRTHLRDLVIVPQMVGMTLFVYSGKSFEQVNVVVEMIGHRLGEFAMSRQIVKHGSAGIGATKGSKAAKK